MPDRLIGRKQAAEILSLSSRRVTEFLISKGAHPVDMGRGRGGGPRWLESAVCAIARRMYEEAQPKPKSQKAPRMTRLGLADMPASEVYALLTKGRAVQ